jgi:hypothetical protein
MARKASFESATEFKEDLYLMAAWDVWYAGINRNTTVHVVLYLPKEVKFLLDVITYA